MELRHGSCLTHELEKPLSPEVKGRFEKLAKGKKSFFQNQAEKLEYYHGGLWRCGRILILKYCVALRRGMYWSLVCLSAKWES